MQTVLLVEPYSPRNIENYNNLSVSRAPQIKNVFFRKSCILNLFYIIIILFLDVCSYITE